MDLDPNEGMLPAIGLDMLKTRTRRGLRFLVQGNYNHLYL